MSALQAGGQLICVENRPWQQGKAAVTRGAAPKGKKKRASLEYNLRVGKVCKLQISLREKQQPLTLGDDCFEISKRVCETCLYIPGTAENTY